MHSDRLACMRDITTSFALPGQASQFQRNYIGSADINRSLPRFLRGCILIAAADGVVEEDEATNEALTEKAGPSKGSGMDGMTFCVSTYVGGT